ncbi:hypothetical protein ACVXG7_29090 [Enterobacter hormaechei]
MNRQPHADFFCHRHDSAQEARHVFTQLVFIDIAIFRQARAELIEGIALSAPGRPAMILRTSFSMSASLAAFEPRQRLLLLFGGVACFRTRTLQNVQLESRKSDLIKRSAFEPSAINIGPDATFSSILA